LTCDGNSVSSELLIDHDSAGIAISSFGQDEKGNIYIIAVNTGKVYKLAAFVGVKPKTPLNEKFSIDRNILVQNHSQTTIHLNLSEGQKIQVSLYDASGRDICQIIDKYFSGGEYSINFSSATLPNGMYFLRMTCANGIQVQKIIIQG
jgi:hypothetical protein